MPRGDRRALRHAPRHAGPPGHGTGKSAPTGGRSPDLSDTDLLSKCSSPQPRRRSGRSTSSSTMPGSTRDNLFPLRMKDAEWDSVLAINLSAAFRLSRAALQRHDEATLRPHHQHRRRSSPSPAISGQGIRRRESRHDRHVRRRSPPRSRRAASPSNCIAPGFIESPMTDALNDRQRETILAAVPVGRLGRRRGNRRGGWCIWRVGQVSYVTGQTLHINGGMAMI